MLRIGAFALYFTVIFSFCVSLPTGELRFMLISEDQELQIGLDAFDEILDKEIISTNRRLKRILRRVGRRIVRHAHKPNVRYDWEFKLFDSGAVNAFCLPGGKVGFHEGILRVCQNEAGLAAVMGHEISHAISRHTGQRISRQLAINYIISYASVSF
ncbi:MAG: M48 family metalloprotease, partial [Spirochaetota bacterium]|nr:M48 family metalloprotease [Spirochaetota bacterium]